MAVLLDVLSLPVAAAKLLVGASEGTSRSACIQPQGVTVFRELTLCDLPGNARLLPSQTKVSAVNMMRQLLDARFRYTPAALAWQ